MIHFLRRLRSHIVAHTKTLADLPAAITIQRMTWCMRYVCMRWGQTPVGSLRYNTLILSHTHKHMHVWEKLMELKRRWLKLLWAGLMLYVKVCAIAQWEWKERWWVQDMNVEEEERRYVWIIPISLWSEHMNARAKWRLQESKNDMENTKLKPLSTFVCRVAKRAKQGKSCAPESTGIWNKVFYIVLLND